MILTRATDNRLKAFFTGGEVRYGATPFQGKGFRSLGPGSDLRRGDPPAARRGVTAAPTAAGRATSSRRDPRPRRRARDAPRARDRADGPQRADGQGRPADERQGPAHRRLRLGHPAACGAARDLDADGRRAWRWRSGATGPERVAVSFIGEGGTSLGEWHEAINLCAARRLPAIFCVQNNQTALSTPVARPVGRARVRRQGGRLRHPRHHDRRHRSRRDRGGVRLGRGARARGRWARR